MTYRTSEFKSGLKVILGEDPYTIIKSEFVKPGKGQAFNRVKLRNLKTGRVLERTFKSGESLEAADVIEIEMQYLYNDGECWYFMNPTTYEQQATDKSSVKDAIPWLKVQDMYQITIWNNLPLLVEPKNFVTLKIVRTDPSVRGDAASGSQKVATLETGATIRVPLFVEENDWLRIDTRTGKYVSRVKQ